MSEKMKGARANWTEDSRAAFIHAMVAEIRRGNYVDSGFKKAGWGQIVEDLNTQTGGSFSKQQCQSLYPKLKADWIAYSAIIGNSGFGIDPETLAPTAPKSVWDTLIVAHPFAAQFRYKALKHFDELDIVFYGSSATGKFAKSLLSQVTPSQKHSRVSNIISPFFQMIHISRCFNLIIFFVIVVNHGCTRLIWSVRSVKFVLVQLISTYEVVQHHSTHDKVTLEWK